MGEKGTKANEPSTGKSSNSSSSSSAAAGFCGCGSLSVEEVSDAVVAFAVGAEPSGAEDMVVWGVWMAGGCCGWWMGWGGGWDW